MQIHKRHKHVHFVVCIVIIFWKKFKYFQAWFLKKLLKRTGIFFFCHCFFSVTKFVLISMLSQFFFTQSLFCTLWQKAMPQKWTKCAGNAKKGNCRGKEKWRPGAPPAGKDLWSWAPSLQQRHRPSSPQSRFMFYMIMWVYSQILYGVPWTYYVVIINNIHLYIIQELLF